MRLETGSGHLEATTKYVSQQIPPITTLRSFLQVLQTFSECFQHHLKNPSEFKNKDNLVGEFLKD